MLDRESADIFLDEVLVEEESTVGRTSSFGDSVEIFEETFATVGFSEACISVLEVGLANALGFSSAIV